MKALISYELKKCQLLLYFRLTNTYSLLWNGCDVQIYCFIHYIEKVFLLVDGDNLFWVDISVDSNAFPVPLHQAVGPALPEGHLS